MATELIVCPRCGASPTAPADMQGQYVCGYCGSRYRSQQTVARPVHVSPPVQPRPAPAPLPAKKTSPTGVVLAIVGILVLFGAASGVAAVIINRAASSSGGGSGGTPFSGANPNGEALLGAPKPAEPEVPASATFEPQSHVSGYQKSFYVLGFVTNTSPFIVEKPKITAILLDAAGKELATRDGFAECDALASKATAPIKILISDPPAHDRLKFEVVVRKADYLPEAAAGLRLEVLEAPHVTFGTSWEVTGKVFNEGKQSARFVKIDMQAFDAKNVLVGLDSTYVDGEAIAPGASARFRAMPLYDAAPHHFKYTVSGQVSK